jgi:hypothetical protein
VSRPPRLLEGASVGPEQLAKRAAFGDGVRALRLRLGSVERNVSRTISTELFMPLALRLESFSRPATDPAQLAATRSKEHPAVRPRNVEGEM